MPGTYKYPSITLLASLPLQRRAFILSGGPPLNPFINLNFDGASKGKSRLVGIGGAFKNEKGDILHIFVESIGSSTKNVVEMLALITRINIARRIRWMSLFFEGDSHIIQTR